MRSLNRVELIGRILSIPEKSQGRRSRDGRVWPYIKFLLRTRAKATGGYADIWVQVKELAAIQFVKQRLRQGDYIHVMEGVLDTWRGTGAKRGTYYAVVAIKFDVVHPPLHKIREGRSDKQVTQELLRMKEAEDFMDQMNIDPTLLKEWGVDPGYDGGHGPDSNLDPESDPGPEPDGR